MKKIAIGFLFAATWALSVQATPPLPREYATWNPGDANPAVSFSPDLLTVTRTFEGTEWAGVRATIGLHSGAWYWETAHTFTDYAESSAGVVRSVYPLDVQPGPVAGSVIVRHWLDMETNTYRFAVDSGAWSAGGTIFGIALYPIVGFTRPNGAVSTTANFGQHPFAYNVPYGGNPGVYFDDAIMASGFE